MGRQGNQHSKDRRKRSRRRRRHQISTWLILGIMVTAVAAGTVLTARLLSQMSVQEEQAVQTQVTAEGENQQAGDAVGQGQEDREEAFPTQSSTAAEDSTEKDSKEDTAEGTTEEGTDGGSKGTQEESPVLTREEQLELLVSETIEAMPLEDQVAGLFMVAPESITGVTAAIQAREGTRKALEQYAVGGIVYFSKNIQNEEQLKAMLRNTQEYSRYPLFIGIDEEGGIVSRLEDTGLSEGTASAAEIAATGEAANAYQAGSTIGEQLSELGFNLDFAPVADLSNVENSVMKERSYGADAGTASVFVTSMLKGLTDQGVIGCLKHFPGIGSTTADTHKGIAVSGRSAEEFRTEEFAVFEAGIDAGAQMVMVGHMSAPALTGDDTPCTLSYDVVTGILRQELRFQGVIITDAMDMSAVSAQYSADEAAVLALQAGCDMILMPADFQAAYEGVLKAVREGTLSEERIEESLRRIYRVKYADRVE